MTWKLKVRSNPGSVVTADYECPEHGRFTAEVERDANGDPPSEVADMCPGVDTEHYCAEPPCLDCGGAWDCNRIATWRPSAAGHVKVSLCSVVQGRSEARPADRYVMNTEKLADGMPYHEWKAERAKIHRDESLRRVRAAFGKTPKAWSMPK